MGGGGTSTSTTTSIPDYEYNARMAAIAEAQQALADEMMGYYREYALPYDQQQLSALGTLLPYQHAYEHGVLQMQTGLLPYQETVARQGLELQGGYLGAMMNAGMPQQLVDARSTFLKEAREGLDIQGRVGAAQADVLKGYGGVLAQQRLAESRLGIRPDSGIARSMSQDMAVQQAGALTGARTQARERAEQEQFARLEKAAGLGLGV